MKILNKKLIAWASIAGFVAVTGFVYFLLHIHYNNLHVEYHNLYAADSAKIANRANTMWNVIRDKFSVKEEYFDEFYKIAKTHVEAFRANGAVFRFLATQLPQISPSIYHEVMATVESERLAMENSQNNILNVCKFHNDLVIKRISCWFIADKTPLTWEVIVSDETREIMKTRKDERTIESLRTQ